MPAKVNRRLYMTLARVCPAGIRVPLAIGQPSLWCYNQTLTDDLLMLTQTLYTNLHVSVRTERRRVSLQRFAYVLKRLPLQLGTNAFNSVILRCLLDTRHEVDAATSFKVINIQKSSVPLKFSRSNLHQMPGT
uniref:Uncharacterized protein n=1 Tax=Trichobilharzia regenti TaxID=157069 RepID=A0AA85IZZ5_TRIRE|nr:unnamed protein product [Trichobilharzia regenti]